LLPQIPLGDERLSDLREFVEKVYLGLSAKVSSGQLPAAAVSAV